MQQEQITFDSVELFEIQEQVVTRGPVPLQPEMLAWVSGGVSSSEQLPNATW